VRRAVRRSGGDEGRVLDVRQVGARAEVAAGAGEHENARIADLLGYGPQREHVLRVNGVAHSGRSMTAIRHPPAALAPDHETTYVDGSMTAITSPSLTWSSGATRTSVRVPATGATTGISIFHRFEDGDGVALGDQLSRLSGYLPHVGGDLGQDVHGGADYSPWDSWRP